MKRTKKLTPYSALLAAALVAAAVPAVAQTLNEVEPNDSITSAQLLPITVDTNSPKGSAVVNGVIGRLTGDPVLDLDFYSFKGQKGDVVTIDIDGGMGGLRSVDTMIAVFGPSPINTLQAENDDADARLPLDEGSISPYDSRIDNFLLPATGFYTVGVSSWPRRFTDSGATYSTALNGNSNGDYTLRISGVTSSLLHITIDIKPGNDRSPSPINPKSQGKIPVALLSSSNFNAIDVDAASLRFGATGTEASLSKCNQQGEDLNDDGLLDLICHFENQLAGFSEISEAAILTGSMKDGRALEGRGRLKVVPKKARF